MDPCPCHKDQRVDCRLWHHGASDVMMVALSCVLCGNSPRVRIDLPYIKYVLVRKCAENRARTGHSI
jgi:hypothetical protein